MSVLDLAVTIPPAEDLAPVHFVGVGGVGMSGIARVMLARGLSVSGSDAKDVPVLAALRALGGRPLAAVFDPAVEPVNLGLGTAGAVGLADGLAHQVHGQMPRDARRRSRLVRRCRMSAWSLAFSARSPATSARISLRR